MTYILSKKSLSKLEGIHPQLIKVVKEAIKITSQDFTVVEGVRSKEQQLANIKKGVSQTLNSKHIKQVDGLGYAVDLAPYVNGSVNWDLKYFYAIATAMKESAEKLGITIRWGGSWSILNNDKRTPLQMIEDYSKARKKAGNKLFIDAPHFELIN